jgi:hypothetical protein
VCHGGHFTIGRDGELTGKQSKVYWQQKSDDGDPKAERNGLQRLHDQFPGWQRGLAAQFNWEWSDGRM